MELKPGDLFELPKGLFRLAQERPGNILLFEREGLLAEDLPLHRDELELMHGRGEAAKVDFFKTRDLQTGAETVQRSNDNAVFGPHEEHSPDAVRAKTFQFYVKAWDKDGSVGRGKKGLAKFIDDLTYDAHQRGFKHDVKPGRLWHAIRNCGVKGERPLRLFRSRRGRTSRKRLGETVHGLLDQAVGFYWTERGRDFHDAQAFFRSSISKENEERRKFGEPDLKPPKRMETLRRRINASISHANWALKYSKAEADQKFLGVRDSLQADKPLELVIMDHTPVDTWSVLDTHTYIPLGRATLTVAIDVATRMILGHLLSFEPPSVYSVLRTLERVNKNKRYIKKLYPEIEGASDGWGHPETILVDNGLEFVGSSFQEALADLGTEVIWAPVRTPQYKAVGERFFHTLNTMLFHKLKGGVPYDPKVMRQVGLNPRDDAVISLGDLDSLIHHAIITYQNERHEGLGAIPARIWKEKTERYGRRYIPDVKQLNAILGRVETGQLTKAGIRFKNMIFHDHETTTRLLADMEPKEAKRRQSRGKLASFTVNVKFKWDPIDASKISVWNHGGQPKKHYLPLPNRDKKFSDGISFWQADKIRKYQLEKDEAFQTDEQKWNARNSLREHWERVAGLLPMRDSKDARRGLSQISGTREDPIETDDPLKDTEIHVEGDDAPLVPAEPHAYTRIDDDTVAAGLPRSKASIRKEAETRKLKKAERAANKKAEAKAENKRQASGEPMKPGTTGTAFADSLMGKLKWKNKQ